MTLSDSLQALEQAMLAVPGTVSAEVSLAINDDTPDGYVEEHIGSSSTRYFKVVEAKNGMKTKTITLYIAD